MTARERPDVALVGLGDELAACARPDRQDRHGSRLPGHRAPARARSRLHQGGIQARRLRPHQRRRRRGLAELDRHRPAPLRRVPRPRRRVRAPRADRARQGHPDGTPRHRRGRAPSSCCASTRASTTASSSTSPPPSSTATACSPKSRRPLPRRRSAPSTLTAGATRADRSGRRRRGPRPRDERRSRRDPAAMPAHYVDASVSAIELHTPARDDRRASGQPECSLSHRGRSDTPQALRRWERGARHGLLPSGLLF